MAAPVYPIGTKIAWVKHQPLTTLLPYGSIIITCSIIFVVLLSNLLERWLLRIVYGQIWKDLDAPGNERRRRSFTYYHVGAIMLSVLMATGAYPVMSFLAGPSDFSNVVGRRWPPVTVGDMMFLFAEVYSAYYLYEMAFRTRFASPLTIAHHIGLLLITQTAIALFAKPHDGRIATMEFFMCMVWGAFDVVVELPIFVCMIIWRVKIDNHRLLSRIGYGLAVWIVVGASTEVAVTAYLLNRSWDQWDTAFRIVTPVIFSLWIVTQLYGGWRLFQMGKSKAKAHRESKDEEDTA